MANCLNRNTKEFKDLVEELNSADPIGLAADIEIWQDSNGLDKFPTKLELVDKKPQPKLIKNDTKINLKKVFSLSSSKVSSMKSAMVKKALRIYNNKNNTRHEIKFNHEFGDTYSYVITENWNGYNPSQTNLFNENKFKGNIDKDLQSKFFESFNESTALDVLTKIANSKHSLAQLAKRLINHSKSNNVKIILEDKDGFSMKELGNIDASDSDFANAYYNSKTNTIHIAKGGYFREGLSEATIMHEVLHSITFHKLNSSPSNDSTVRDFNKLYSYALTKLNKDDFYGLSDRHEFLVALFTDPKLVNALKGIESSKNTKQYTNLFQEIFDLILSLVGIGRSSSLYEQAFAVATHVISEASESREALADSINNEESIVFSKADKKEIPAPTFETQYVFFKRRINTLGKQLEKVAEGTDEYKIKESELKAITVRFEKATEENNKAEYIAMANDHLDWVEILIGSLPENPDKYTIANLVSAFEILNTFKDFTGLKDRPNELREQLFPYISRHNLSTINNYNTDGVIKTQEDIDKQVNDIRDSTLKHGSLSDVYNLIGSTVGAIIKTAQNKASSNNKILEHKVQAEVDKLIEWGKNNNMSLEQVYDIFLQENKSGTLILTQRFDKDGKTNDNFNKILNDETLKDFYIFYQRILKDAESILPYKVGPSYVLNKVKSDLKSDLKRVIPTDEYLFDNFISNEELLVDAVPDMYRTKISADKKSRDLGSGLLQFAAYANNHNELSNALPETRLLQEQLKYKQDGSGHITERTYIKSSDPTRSIKAEDSNIFNLVKTVIEMQIKGKMHDNKEKPFNLKEIKDAEGNLIGYKQLHIEDVIDKGLRWNSLLRIGLAPITSTVNVLFGNLSNYIEAVGGKHFTVKQLSQANKIFAGQITYLPNSEKDSNLYKWLEKLNPLQELADYDLGSGLVANKKVLTKEKLFELMYIMQKKGELQLQSTTMLALLINEGYITTDGKNTSKGDNISAAKAIELSDKIQRLNQLIHGRYSQREAATVSQSVWWRAGMQFRKWIPSAIEARFGDYKPWDRRLQTDIEGRYRTYGKVFKADSVGQAFENLFLPILSSKAALERGNMTPTEIYNMRKNMIELILLTSTLLLAAGLKSGDDEERRRKLRNPFIKTGLTMLNRISGDLLFFYNPTNISNIASNAAPISKLMIDIMKVTATLPHAFYLDFTLNPLTGFKGDYKVDKGSLKDSNEWYVKHLPRVFPGFSSAAQLQRIFNEQDILPELN